MWIEKLFIQNLRNHVSNQFSFNNGINLVYGRNGAGKTTILEAISILSLTKSFLPVSDANMIRFGEKFYMLHSDAKTDLNTGYKISINFESGQRKRIKSNAGDNLNPKDIVGEMPIVVLSPDFKSITFGSPADRRNFIDKVLSQSSKRYYNELVKVKRSLKQRNSLLLSLRKGDYVNQAELDLWTNQLIQSSAQIIIRRNKFIDEFRDYFKTTYEFVSNGKENVDFAYEPNAISPEFLHSKLTVDSIQDMYKAYVQNIKLEEVRRGTTLFGPQKDELLIQIGSGTAKDHASQGQHKSLLISIKMAEFKYLRDIRNETPILLLDDIFSELDDDRSTKVLDMIQNFTAQTFITITDPVKLEQLIKRSENYSFTEIENGKIKELE